MTIICSTIHFLNISYIRFIFFDRLYRELMASEIHCGPQAPSQGPLVRPPL